MICQIMAETPPAWAADGKYLAAGGGREFWSGQQARQVLERFVDGCEDRTRVSMKVQEATHVTAGVIFLSDVAAALEKQSCLAHGMTSRGFQSSLWRLRCDFEAWARPRVL